MRFDVFHIFEGVLRIVTIQTFVGNGEDLVDAVIVFSGEKFDETGFDDTNDLVGGFVQALNR